MRLRVLPLALVLLVAGTAPAPAGRPHRECDAVFQVSTLGALMAGVLGGAMAYGEVEEHGDFGLGTFHALDGEMIAVDGRFYQVRTDGRAVRVPRAERTPFAMVKWFHADRTLELQGASSMDDLARLLDDAIRTPNVFTAVRIDGRFPQITVRSVPRQHRPFPGLAEVVAQQKTFELENVDGTLVGFRSPQYASGITVPGYHFHFLTKNRRAGGHVLALTLGHGRAQLDEARDLDLSLPSTKAFDDAPLTEQDSAAVKAVEGGN
jgi:acetolactate decarboxylase